MELPERFAWNDDLNDNTGWYDADEVEAFLKEVEGVFCDVAQLIDGWNHDGCWSEWDQSVRDKVSKVQKLIFERTQKPPTQKNPIGS